MAHIEVSTEGYKKNSNNFTEFMGISQRELIHALITYGRDTAWFYKNSKAIRTEDFKSRISALRANVEIHNNYFCPTKKYLAEDSTEKGIISYRLGMAFGLVVARRLYNIGHLVHLSSYASSTNSKFPKGNLPDYISQIAGSNRRIETNSEWLLFEAKGASGNKSPSLKNAKAQVEAIKNINGSFNIERVASGLSFRPHAHMKIVDPTDSKGFNVKIDEHDFINCYYSPFVELANKKKELVMEGTNYFPFFQSDTIDLYIDANLCNSNLNIVNTSYKIKNNKMFQNITASLIKVDGLKEYHLFFDGILICFNKATFFKTTYSVGVGRS